MKRLIKNWGLALVVGFVVTVPRLQTAAAQTFDEGTAAYRRGDYAAAMAQWRPLAERGDGEAQQALGLLYDLGYGVPQSFDEAARWYRLAAEGGNAKGQFRLAFMYSYGLGLPKDAAQADAWNRKAAAGGIAAAAAALALHNPRRVPPVPLHDNKLADSSAFRKQQPAHPYDFWAGTDTLPPQLTDQQMNDIVQRLEAAAGQGSAAYGRYYAAVTMRRPDPANIRADYNQYYGLMIETGAARVSVRAVYLRGSPQIREPGVHIVPEKALPVILDGGCSVVTVWYDSARQRPLPPQCNGMA